MQQVDRCNFFLCRRPLNRIQHIQGIGREQLRFCSRKCQKRHNRSRLPDWAGIAHIVQPGLCFRPTGRISSNEGEQTPQAEKRARTITTITVAFLTGALLAIASTAHGHDMYHSWVDKDGYSCCHNRDCRPAESERITPEGYEARVGSTWHKIPPEKLLHKRSPDGQPHICVAPSGMILCYQPGLGA